MAHDASGAADLHDAATDTGPAASELVAACEAAWSSIQQGHPELPDVVIVLGTGVDRGRLTKLGHWWAGRWLADGHVRGEVLLAGEALHLPATEVFEVLLHEAAHGLNAARGVKDCSRGGRYHNARFRSTAEDLGLVVGVMPPYGWARTTISDAAAERYAAQISTLNNAMRIARRIASNVRIADTGRENDRDRSDPDRSNRRGKQPPAECSCGRKLRIAPSVLARGPVVCGICGHDFTVERDTQSITATDPRPPGLRRNGLAMLRTLAVTTEGMRTLVRLSAWYATQASGKPEPLAGRSGTAAEHLNRAARALLMLDGTLEPPGVLVGTHELLVGELVMVDDGNEHVLDADGRALPPSGVIGAVEAVDPRTGRIDVDFAIFGRSRMSRDSDAARALTYGYADHIAHIDAPLRTVRDASHDEPTSNVDQLPVAELSW